MAVYDVGQDHDNSYIVVELVNGKPLYDYIPTSSEMVYPALTHPQMD